jgi:hypothetical protein
VVNFLVDDFLCFIVGSVDQFQFTGTGYYDIGSTVLISVSVSTDDNRFGPTGNGFGNFFDNDGFSENGSAEDVTDGSVR